MTTAVTGTTRGGRPFYFYMLPVAVDGHGAASRYVVVEQDGPITTAHTRPLAFSAAQSEMMSLCRERAERACVPARGVR